MYITNENITESLFRNRVRPINIEGRDTSGKYGKSKLFDRKCCAKMLLNNAKLLYCCSSCESSLRIPRFALVRDILQRESLSPFSSFVRLHSQSCNEAKWLAEEMLLCRGNGTVSKKARGPFEGLRIPTIWFTILFGSNLSLSLSVERKSKKKDRKEDTSCASSFERKTRWDARLWNYSSIHSDFTFFSL